MATPPRDSGRPPKGWVKGKDGIWRPPGEVRRKNLEQAFARRLQGPSRKQYS